MQHSKGKLYGMASFSGANVHRTLFEFTRGSNNTSAKGHGFSSVSDGECPYSALIEGSNGKLYGMTSRGGATDVDTIFEFDLAGNTLTKTHDFDNGNGGIPYRSLIEAVSGPVAVKAIAEMEQIKIYANPWDRSSMLF